MRINFNIRIKTELWKNLSCFEFDGIFPKTAGPKDDNKRLRTKHLGKDMRIQTV